MNWTITENELNILIEWYAMDRVLIEEYDDNTIKKKRIALNVRGDELEEQEYHEMIGMIYAYEDWFRIIGVYKDCQKVKEAMKKFKEENNQEVNYD